MVVKLWDYSGEIDFSRLTTALWCGLAGLAITYGCANLLLAIAWQKLLAHLEWQEEADWCIRTYGLTQIAKYVPGNVFQFAGRQAMGMSRGISGWILARSSFLELALLCMSGSLFVVLVLPAFFAEFSTYLACVLFFLLVSLSTYLVKRVIGVCAAQAHFAYIIFLLISGMIFVIIIILINKNGAGNYNIIFLASAFVIAWLIGLVTPGAPAGVGVRESVIALILHDALPMPDILLALMLGRLVTVCGDVIFFMAASRLSRN